MYQVITMYGDSEPWWFFEEWKKDIEEEKIFNSLKEAEKYYTKKQEALLSTHEHASIKETYLAAFWNDGDQCWCKACDEELQQYKGLALLREYKKINFENSTAKEELLINKSTRNKCYL